MTINTYKIKSAKHQNGIILFFALIALVAMSLAAAALIRSVDNSTLVAGNLAFKQSAQMSADSAFSLASTYLTAPANQAALTTGVATSGYYATPCLTCHRH